MNTYTTLYEKVAWISPKGECIQSPAVTIANSILRHGLWWEASNENLRNWRVSTSFSEQGGRNNRIRIDQWINENSGDKSSRRTSAECKESWLKNEWKISFGFGSYERSILASVRIVYVYSCKFHTTYLIFRSREIKVRRPWRFRCQRFQNACKQHCFIVRLTFSFVYSTVQRRLVKDNESLNV